MADILDDLDAMLNPELVDIQKTFPGAEIVVPTTDEMDHTTPEDRGKLVGFCEFCEEWYKFTRNMNPTPEEELCPKCGGKYSHRIGFQLTSQRSFNPLLAKKKKLPKKR